MSAAHARAEADQASFLEREKVAEEKRRQERQERRVMDSERERNRMRKLNALNGREWDATKQEEDYDPRGGKGQFRRGMHGGVSGHTRRDFDDGRASEASPESHGSHNGHRGRGRGGRNGRGRTNSRGPRKDSAVPEGTPEGPAKKENKALAPPAPVNNESEFPALLNNEKDRPVGTKPESVDNKLDWTASPVDGTSWADQVESQ